MLTLALQALAIALPREEELELLAPGVTSKPRNVSTISLGVDEDGVAVIVEIGVLALDTEEVGVVYIAW